MNYTALNTYLQTLLVDQAPSADYTTILPAAIQDAEQMIYRDLDFLATRTVNPNLTFTIGSRNLAIPTTSTSIIVLQGVAQITPIGVTPAQGTRNTLEPTTLDFIDFVWPTESVTGLGQYWTLLNNALLVVAPTPDQVYPAELTGIFRPTPLSASNQDTYISDTYPDLMINACMVFLCGWQKNFGQQSDDPKMALSWKDKYEESKKSALEEEQRRKLSSTGWSPFSPVMATPPRS